VSIIQQKKAGSGLITGQNQPFSRVHFLQVSADPKLQNLMEVPVRATAYSDKKSAEAGFTLVEIAIVLVIIGLLLGGILKGQEMITQAKIKNVINDFNGITAAMNSYRDRYRTIPGDDNTAAGRWAGSFNGDGNGAFNTGAALEVYNNIPAAAPAAGTPEVNKFWWHLRLSGFVAGPTAVADVASITPPTNATSGILGVQTGSGPTTMGFTSNIICTSNLPDKIAIAVDTQMDDATNSTGQVRGMLQTQPNPTVGTPGSAYQETGTNQYLLCKSL
jgi:prepilin-type N-terminal cleavage/methylation domain-containing protein